MVWVVSECAFNAEITEVVGVATSEERGREMAEEHWTAKEAHVGPKGDGSPLRWDEHGAFYEMHGRQFRDPYLVEEFPVL